MTLDSQTYALQFFPVRHYDHGEYTCLVNERRRPDTIIHLVVQGRNWIQINVAIRVNL
jgi:hypothetical protein